MVKTIENCTYGAFIISFGFYLSPVVKEAKKNQCIKYSTKTALTQIPKNDMAATFSRKQV